MLLCIPLALLPARIRYDNRLYFVLTTIWAWALLRVAGIRWTVEGKDNLPSYPNHPSIIVMNHSSAIDISLAEVLAGTYPHAWLLKAEYTRVPLFNILTKRMHVAVKRGTVREAVKALAIYQKILAGGPRHALLFPEGTRHSDGKIHPFLVGFAVLAKRLSRPVVPVVFVGPHKIFPKGSRIIDAGACTVKVIVGRPMRIAADESPQEFAQRVNGWYARRLAKESS